MLAISWKRWLRGAYELQHSNLVVEGKQSINHTGLHDAPPVSFQPIPLVFRT